MDNPQVHTVNPKNRRTGKFPRAATFILLLATISLVLWLASMRLKIGIMYLGADTSVQIRGGGIELWHVYAHGIGPAVPENDWFSTAVARGWVGPPQAREFPGVSFHDGLVRGEAAAFGGDISPANYWLLRVRLWLPTVMLGSAAVWLFRRWHRRRQRDIRGFEVQAATTD